ncbi:AAA family ATPase [Streptomyces albogriseolus]|uniref:AAA family ATPase n=1 Tax=Streptomyces albogriseolus TaxID=1887 RepID=UPI003D71017E
MTQGQGEQRPPAHGGGDDWQRDVLRELGGGASGSGRPGAEPRRGEPTLRLVHPPPPQPGTTAEAAAGEDASAPHDAPHVAPAAPAPRDPAPRAGAADAPGPGRPASPAAREPRLPAAPAPESSPTLDPRLLLALGSPLHGDSVPRRTGRALRKLTSSVSQDVAEQTRIARELQQPVTTGRVVAVTSIRGGVGKSTVSALLGRTLNHYRHDPVLTLEADTALGTLPVRMGADAVRWTVTDLAPVLHPSMKLTDVTGYLVPVSDGGWLLPASRGQVGPPLDMTAYRKVTLALRRYFAVTVADCETLPGEVARTAMDTAHARVVVAPTTAEGVGATRQVLDWLARLPHSALATTVVALVSNTPDTLLDDKAAAGHLKESGVTVVTVPYDRHLAGGGPIRTDLLAHATRQAVLRLAAEVMGRAVRVR